MKKKLKYHGGRHLLNNSGFHSTAAIVAEIEDTSGWKPGRDRDGDPINNSRWVGQPRVIFQISNCDRSIAFECDGFHDVDAMDNDLAKVDKLIGALTKFRNGLAIEQARYKDRVKAAEEAERDE